MKTTHKQVAAQPMKQLLVVATLVVATSTAANAATRHPTGSAIPANLRETRALDAQLAQLSSECRSAVRKLQQMQRDVRAVRNDLERAAKVARSIRDMEGRLNRLINKLQAYRGVPKVRTVVRTLISNLERLKKSIHSVRKNTDRVEKQALTPTIKKLRSLELKLRKPIASLGAAASNADQSRRALAQAVPTANRLPAARNALEQSSRAVRPTAALLVKAVRGMNTQVNAVQRDLAGMKRTLASFWTVEASLKLMNKQMKPGENVANRLNRVLSKRLSIKLPVPPFKTVGFTIRQILEAPDKVLGVVLKPLEKLADAALKPVFGKLKIQIREPKGLAAMNRSVIQLPRTGASLGRSIASLEAKIQNEVTPLANRFSQLAAQRLVNGLRR